MIVGIGVDAVEISRIEAQIEQAGDRFLDRIYTTAERAYCDGRARPGESYAARFAAKEAVMTCLGTGWNEGIAWRQIEVLRDEHGAVRIALAGAAAEHQSRLGIAHLHLSLTHTETTATAFAVASR